jgi:hypothetical protein
MAGMAWLVAIAFPGESDAAKLPTFSCRAVDFHGFSRFPSALAARLELRFRRWW